MLQTVFSFKNALVLKPDCEEAKQMLQKITKLREAHAYFEQGKQSLAQGEVASAYQKFREALTKDPENIEAKQELLKVLIILRGIRIGYSAHIPGILDRGHLKPVAEPKERHALLSCVFYPRDLTLCSPLTKSAGNNDPANRIDGCRRVNPAAFDILGMYVDALRLDAEAGRGVLDGVVDACVGISWS